MQTLSEFRRILVVDDNADAAELLQTLLSIEGYTVEVAFDGDSALAVASKFAPQVICSDLRMPGLSGFELASALRKARHGRSLHLIALSGLNDENSIQNALDAGFDQTFVKPLNFDIFFAHLRHVFEHMERR